MATAEREEDDVLSLDASSMSGLVDDEDNYQAAQEASSGRFDFSADDADVLLRIVKLAQKHGMAARQGTWKEYLLTVEKSETLDPAQHSWTVLAAFVEGLAGSEWTQLLDRKITWERQAVEEEHALVAARAQQEGLPQTMSERSAWKLVERTAAHPRFADLYMLPSYEDGWHREFRQIADMRQEPVLVGLDCEMCATRDDDRELLGLCLIDADGEVLVQEVVQPGGEVIDLRTEVTGVTAADLEGVTATRDVVRAAVLNAIRRLAATGQQVVIVGHALHHDLKALRLDYRPVIDTSLLFSYRGRPTATPALATLALQLLNRQLRLDGAVHDVADDARAALDVALYEQQKGPSKQLTPPPMQAQPQHLCKLLAHSLPPTMTDAEVAALFPVDAPAVQAVERQQGEQRKAVLVFESADAAKQAFQALQGPESTDMGGHQQKTVTVPRKRNHGGEKVRIRVMGGMARVVKAPRPATFLSAADLTVKRQKVTC